MTDQEHLLGDIKQREERELACPAHKFNMPKLEYNEFLPFGLRLKCLNCGCDMHANYVTMYIRGYKAAGGNPNDIIENYE